MLKQKSYYTVDPLLKAGEASLKVCKVVGCVLGGKFFPLRSGRGEHSIMYMWFFPKWCSVYLSKCFLYSLFIDLLIGVIFGHYHRIICAAVSCHVVLRRGRGRLHRAALLPANLYTRLIIVHSECMTTFLRPMNSFSPSWCVAHCQYFASNDHDHALSIIKSKILKEERINI